MALPTNEGGISQLHLLDQRLKATDLALPDLTIMAQVGHVSPAMMKHYSHIRRQALNQAAAALQPNYSTTSQAVELLN